MIFFVAVEEQKAIAVEAEAAIQRSSRGRRGARSRGGRGRGGRGGSMVEPVIVDPFVASNTEIGAIVLSDNDNESSFDDSYMDSDSDSIVNSDDDDSDGPAWGGYGRCYKCGDSGHWANRCPYR